MKAREWACGPVVGLSSGTLPIWVQTLVIVSFSRIFPEILGYKCLRVGGTARFPHTGGSDASQSLLCVCIDAHTCGVSMKYVGYVRSNYNRSKKVKAASTVSFPLQPFQNLLYINITVTKRALRPWKG